MVEVAVTKHGHVLVSVEYGRPENGILQIGIGQLQAEPRISGIQPDGMLHLRAQLRIAAFELIAVVVLQEVAQCPVGWAQGAFVVVQPGTPLPLAPRQRSVGKPLVVAAAQVFLQYIVGVVTAVDVFVAESCPQFEIAQWVLVLGEESGVVLTDVGLRIAGIAFLVGVLALRLGVRGLCTKTQFVLF